MAKQIGRTRYLNLGPSDQAYKLNVWDYVDLDFLCLHIVELGDKEVSQAIQEGMPAVVMGAHRYATWKVVRETWPQLVTMEDCP